MLPLIASKKHKVVRLIHMEEPVEWWQNVTQNALIHNYTMGKITPHKQQSS